ncbi:MAG TPA: ParB/RepB/Spo0J family partition protein [Terriglobales bacterium]|nr:ParB/RepB/Spo0J family partition protein [Terriglobales bacterium]
MNDKRKALGRGLDALLPSNRSATAVAPQPASPNQNQGAKEIPLDLIDRNPFQTRGQVDEIALEELAASIRVQGVLQPVVLRPLPSGRFQLMAGERRWMASRRAGKQTVPAVVRAASDEQAMEITIIENLQREDLNVLEQARAYERLSRDFGLTQEQMAQKTGKDRTSVSNFLRLLKLPPAIQQELEKGTLSFGHAKALMMLPNPSLMEKCARQIESKKLSVRQTEDLVRSLITPAERAEKSRKHVDPNVRAAQLELQSALGCKVEITDRKGRGKIVIQYATLEDFDRVLEMLSARK